MNRSSNTVNGAPPASQAQTMRPTVLRESSSSSMRRLDLSLPTRQPAQPARSASAATSASASPYASGDSSPTRPSARSHSPIKAAIAAAAAAAAASATSSTSASAEASAGEETVPSQAPPTAASSSSATTAPKQASRSASATPTIRSRRNSQQDPSPTRIRSSVTTLPPQRPGALSSATTPTLLPVTVSSDASSARATPGPQKSEQPRDGARWSVSSRLRSPPPTLNRPKAPSAAATTLTDTSSAAPSLSLDAVPASDDSEADELHLQPGMRTPLRGPSGNVPTLETVQEASPLSASRAVGVALEKLKGGDTTLTAPTTSTPEVTEVSTAKTLRARQVASQSSSDMVTSDVGSIRPSRRTAPSASGSASGPTPPSLATRHSSSKVTGKGKSGEGSQPTMTVETETVTSISNVTLGPNTAQGANGSLRAKPSSETIRPKKEKKRTSRKQAAVTPGTATSKADIFEAKIASAVDEANTSDSEETFVYDSTDGRDRPRRFHHSRTPSATSLANDRSGMRSIHSILEGVGPGVVTMKKMKFVNTLNGGNANDSGLGDDEASTATVRGGPGSSRSITRPHHHTGAGSHIGRWGLGGPKNGHQSILDESPFPGNSSSRLKLMGSGNGSSNGHGYGSGNGTSATGGRSATSSPRPQGSFSGRGSSGTYSHKRSLGHGPAAIYDLDAVPDQANDERTPLMGARAAARTSRVRRHHVALRSLEDQTYPHPNASFLNRFASCLVVAVMVMLVITGAIGFMFATSQPLEDIELVKISSVIASEQELMFDVMVRAHNPNVVVVTVDAADMEVFAKSPHAGTDSEWWRRTHGGDVAENEAGAEADAPDNEPRDPPDSSAPNFLLGKFTAFDNPLSFEGSFFHHGLSTSRSGVRIRRPGNGTAGGSERWERILDDEFDLIIKGVLRYSLPLSQRVRSALIEGRTTVRPNEADDPSRHPNGTVTISTPRLRK